MNKVFKHGRLRNKSNELDFDNSVITNPRLSVGSDSLRLS